MKLVVKSLLSAAVMTVCVVFLPTEARAQCRLCAESNELDTLSKGTQRTRDIPLQIEITANLDFSRMALLGSGGGVVSIDPISGYKQIQGGITNLGGLSLYGEGRLKGEPGRNVRVSLPEHILLSAPNGSMAELEKLETNLPALARLDQTGSLVFTFGGQLRVRGAASGQFRGRIAITADYE